MWVFFSMFVTSRKHLPLACPFIHKQVAVSNHAATSLKVSLSCVKGCTFNLVYEDKINTYSEHHTFYQ